VFQTAADIGEQRDRYIFRTPSLGLPLDVRGRSRTDNRQKVGKNFRLSSWHAPFVKLPSQPAARLRLGVASKPYWRVIEERLHLGYRRRATGGSWIARRRNDEVSTARPSSRATFLSCRNLSIDLLLPNFLVW